MISGLRMLKKARQFAPVNADVAKKIKEGGVSGIFRKKSNESEVEDVSEKRESYFTDQTLFNNDNSVMEISAIPSVIRPMRGSMFGNNADRLAAFDEEEESDRQNVLRRKRGSLFGSNGSSLFGN